MSNCLLMAINQNAAISNTPNLPTQSPADGNRLGENLDPRWSNNSTIFLSPVCNEEAPGSTRVFPPGFHRHERPGWESIFRGVSWSGTQKKCSCVWGGDQNHLHLAPSWVLHAHHRLHMLHKLHLALGRHLKGDGDYTSFIHPQCSHGVAQWDQLFPLDLTTLLRRHILPRSSDCNCFASIKNSKTKPDNKEWLFFSPEFRRIPPWFTWDYNSALQRSFSIQDYQQLAGSRRPWTLSEEG